MPDEVVPISKAVVDIFAKEPRVNYAKDDKGSMYICDGRFMLKTNQDDMDNLIERVNRRGRSQEITAAENPRIIEYIDKIKGDYELTRQPYDWATHDNKSFYIFADDKRYYGYNSRYVDAFNHSGSRLFINDKESSDINNHSMIIKSRDSEVLGVVLPIKIPDTLIKKLKKDYPLESKKGKDREGSKENPLTYPRQTPWGEARKCEKLCPGVFTVEAVKGGGIMVIKDMTAALSSAAHKRGVMHGGFMCFDKKHAKDVAIRELLDKKLWSVPERIKDKAAFEENINNTLREYHPDYWRSRERGRQNTPPSKPAPALAHSDR